MVEDLNHSVWVAYCGAMRIGAPWDAATAFQAAVDVLLARHPEIAAEPACRLTVRMIMREAQRPPGYRDRVRATGRPLAPTHPLTARRAPR
jgi:hypothetical protein